MSKAAPAEIYAVRGATAQDAVAIARLAADLGYPAPPEVVRERIRAITASSSDLLLVAADQSGEPHAWLQVHAATLIESGFRAEIVGLIVSPSARRAGIGRSLVAAAERWATAINAPSLVVRSNAQRVESHAFYPALGFRPTKTQHVYQKLLGDRSSEERIA